MRVVGNTINFKRVASIIIGINLIFSQAVFGASVPSDVFGQSYETAVAALFEKGIITGDENGMFNPEQTLTRAQACIIVVKSMNPPVAEVAGTATQDVLRSGFPDMSGYSWAEGYISYAVKKGVTKGYPDGTFKPGNKVSSNELITMVLRGAGYSDASMEGTWPLNYKNMAETLNLYTGLPINEAMPEFATKWMAAQMGYNAVALIEEANKPGASPVFGIPKTLPDFTEFKFITNGSFDSNVASFGGIPLSDNVQVFTYLERKDYGEKMLLSDLKSDYETENVYKYKRVVTPAQYKLDNGKISCLILPKDVGYTGTIYCVINDASKGIYTLTAAREIHWKVGTGMKTVLSGQAYLDGTVFKLSATDGLIQKIEPMADMGNGYSKVEGYKINGPVETSGNDRSKWTEISAAATVYIMGNSTQNKYRIGSTANIKEGSQIRLFDVSDDDENKADIIVIKE